MATWKMGVPKFLLTTNHSNVFTVVTIMNTPVTVITNSNFALSALALHWIQPDGSRPFSEFIVSQGPAGDKSELSTHHVGINIIKHVVTDRSPFVVVWYFHSSFHGIVSVHQSNCKLLSGGRLYIRSREDVRFGIEVFKIYLTMVRRLGKSLHKKPTANFRCDWKVLYLHLTATS